MNIKINLKDFSDSEPLFPELRSNGTEYLGSYTQEYQSPFTDKKEDIATDIYIEKRTFANNGKEFYELYLVEDSKHETRTPTSTMVTGASLSRIDVDNIEQAINGNLDQNSLDVKEVATLMAISKGYLDVPKTVYIGNSFLKDKEFVDDFIQNNSSQSITNIATMNTLCRLPDFYVFESKEEAEKYCNPVGAYSAVKTVHPHHLQGVAASIRLDIAAEKSAKEAWDEVLSQYPEDNSKLNKYLDSAAKDFIKHNKDELTEAVRVLDHIFVSEKENISQETLDKVNKLSGSDSYLESLMSQETITNAIHIRAKSAQTHENGNQPATQNIKSFIHDIDSNSKQIALAIEIERHAMKSLFNQVDKMMDDPDSPYPHGKRSFLNCQETRDMLIKKTLKALSSSKEASLER